jgi:hypothetical protein
VGDHRVEQEPRGRLIGIADAEVDDVLALLLERGALALELGDEFGRELPETVAGR